MKRQASASPQRDRSSKRATTSSPPEEGELDDGAPISQQPSTSLPPPPATLPSKPVKPVPFPFKKKAETTTSNVKPINVFGTPSGSGSRPEPPRNTKDDDSRRNRGPPEPKSRIGDHWEPTYDHHNRGRSWGDGGRDYRDRDFRNRSPRRSMERSRSPRRDRHRLPIRHSPSRSSERGYTPPRSRSRSRDRGYDRYRDRDDRWRPDFDRDRDRHYRPHDHYRPDDREWTRRGDADRRRVDSYRPQSPGSKPPSSPPPPRSPELPPVAAPAPPPPPQPSQPPPPPAAPPSEPIEPRPPSDTPPPPPPPDPRLMNNPPPPPTGAVKRPSLPPTLPNKPVFSSVPPPSLKPKPPAPPPAPPKIRVVKRRTASKRTDKQDMEAYGRVFVGCGQQSDYEVTTKLGEGTFGEVHKAIQKATGASVALKRILMHHEKEGMPVTALREIKILKALKHPCIVNILDMFVVRSSEKDPLSVYMVFPYMDHDLAGLLENERVKLQPSQIKLYMKQLLEGTEYMHRNHILHRDMKAANLLISNTGNLRIADFGLARSFDTNITKGGSTRKYTNCVVTRWYRPPELLLGARQYGGEVDIWGIGCVLGEMFNRRPILPGSSDLDQLEKIWYLCGTPTQHSWPNFDALPGCDGVKHFKSNHIRRVKMTYESVGAETADLLDKLLVCNPKERITAAQALEHEYFWTDPLPADPKTLPVYEASHEFDKRGQRNHQPMMGHHQPSKYQDPSHRLPPPAGNPQRRQGNHRGPPGPWPGAPPLSHGPHAHPPGPGSYNMNQGPPPGMPGPPPPGFRPGPPGGIPMNPNMGPGPYPGGRPQFNGPGGPRPPGPGAYSLPPNPGGRPPFRGPHNGPPGPPGGPGRMGGSGLPPRPSVSLPPKPAAPLGGGVALGTVPRSNVPMPGRRSQPAQPPPPASTGSGNGYAPNGGLNYG